MHDKLLNIKEVAEYLGVSEDGIRELVAKGEMPAYKVGGLLLRFKKEQIEQYHKKTASGSTAESKGPVNRIEGRFAHLTGAQQAAVGRRIFRRQGESVPYSFLEKLEDFLYYNYIAICKC